MKLHTLLAAVLVIALFSRASCDKVKDKIKVNVPLSLDFPLTIGVVSTTDTTIVLNAEVKQNIDDIVNEFDDKLSAENVKSIYIKSASLKIDEDSRYEAPNNLTSFQSVTAFISSSSFPTKVKIAYAENLDNPYEVAIPIEKEIDASLINYFKATGFNVEFNFKLKAPTTQPLNATATVEFTLVTQH